MINSPGPAAAEWSERTFRGARGHGIDPRVTDEMLFWRWRHVYDASRPVITENRL